MPLEPISAGPWSLVPALLAIALACAAIAGVPFLVLGFLVPGDFSFIPY